MFHFRDDALFAVFVRPLTHAELVQPLKQHNRLAERYFKGHRLGNGSPHRDQLIAAYRKEILSNPPGEHTGVIANYLCACWIGHQPSLTARALEALGMDASSVLDVDTWIHPLHQLIETEDWRTLVPRVVRSLAHDRDAQDIAIVVSILFYPCTDQPALQQAVADELLVTTNDPVVILEHTRVQISAAQTDAQNVNAHNEQLIAAYQVSRTQVVEEISRLEADLSAARADRTDIERQSVATHSEFDAIQAKFRNLERVAEQAKTREAQTERRLTHAQRTLEQADTAEADRAATIAVRRRDIESTLTRLRQQLTVAEAEARLVAEREIALREQERQRAVGAQISATVPTALPVRERVETVVARMQNGPFSSSACTLELLARHIPAEVVALPATSPKLDLANADALAAHFASVALSAETPWDRDALAHYAYWRSISIADQHLSAELLLSGVYHAARARDDALGLCLVVRLAELSASIEATTPLADGLTASALRALENHLADAPSARLFGLLQTKVASADPRALSRLYDLLDQRTKILAKRALVAHLGHVLLLDEHDPTHEILDTVTTAVRGPLSGIASLMREWWSGATLHTISGSRSAILAASSKLTQYFGSTTGHAVERLRNVLSTPLTKAIGDGTLDSYYQLLNVAANYMDGELRQPTWLGARFLFPAGVAVARASMSAATEARRSLRSAVTLSLGKTQHPIGENRRAMPLTVRVHNEGNTDADRIHLVFAPAPEDAAVVSMHDAEVTLPTLPPRGTHTTDLVVDVNAPAKALEIEYLVTWSDVSSSERLDTGRLKIVAQRTINWEQATVNPYALRSISDPERLFGRDDILDRLQRGIAGGGSFGITGQKRVGKTSVSRVLGRLFDARLDYVTAYLTLGEVSAVSAAAFIGGLAKTLLDDIPLPQRELPAFATVSGGQFTTEPIGAARAFVKGLEEALPNHRFLVIIDDFDELDEQLYRGSEASVLFLFLRSIIDRGPFSVVFVGSERLPEILRYQGEKLNQVAQLSLEHLTDLESLGRLVRSPTEGLLEFSDAAVDRIDVLSARNPFYATKLCQRIYDDMVTRRDYHVGSADVDRSVAALLREDQVSTYQHFWKDGVFVSGPDAERFQHINALVLIAVSVLNREDEGPPTRDQVVAHAAVEKVDRQLVHHRINNLIERRVLQGTGDRLAVRVPLLAMWLRGAGAGEVRASFGERDVELAMTPVFAGVADQELVSVAQDLVYHGQVVNEVRLRAWLTQFGAGRQQLLAFKLLRRLKEAGYFSEARVYGSFKTLHSLVLAEVASAGWAQLMERRKVTNIFVTHLDAAGKSGAALLYAYRQANQIPAQLTGMPDEARAFLRSARRPVVVIFVDDIVGTGGTIGDGFGEFMKRLRDEGCEVDQHMYLAVVLAGLGSGMHAVESQAGDRLRVLTGLELRSSDRAFSPEANIFSSDEERVEAEALCRSIGEAIEPRHPLGFNDCQALVVFHHRCPNNTLPIFFRGGRSYQGKEWQPLFAR